MKPNQHITPLGKATIPADIWGWAQALLRLHARIAPRFTLQSRVAVHWRTCKAS